MRFLHDLRIRPVYLLVVERVMSRISLDDILEIEKNLDKIAKQRDDIVAQLYKTMLFLSTLMIFIFLIEVNLAGLPETLMGFKLSSSADTAIFGFLLIGNIVALLFSSAMVKMFVLEYVLDSYWALRSEGPRRYIANVTYRFYVFIFDLIGQQTGAGVPKFITRLSRIIHVATVLILPITFISIYCSVLYIALLKFWAQSSTDRLELWYFAVLVFFNLLTLSLYAFAFFPCPARGLSYDVLESEIKERANALWENAGRPKGRFTEIEQLAERQIKLRHHLL
jgi:DUF2934 family protein